jgi:signal transduction histidine kinase
MSAQLPLVSVDRERIGEAIYHLVHNAVKFNRSDGSVWISCHPADAALLCEVADTGLGISPEKLDVIWEAFSQSADEVRRGVEGLGLGLALVKSTVEAHGGEVMASSTPGAGSTFGFRLPIV